MEWHTSATLYRNDGEVRLIHPMASPPLDMVSLSQLPFEMEHGYHPMDMDRKIRSENQLLPLEKYARGGVSPYLLHDMEPSHENATYRLPPRTFDGKDSNLYGSFSGDFDYPSPFGTVAAESSSISESDRSPSPQVLAQYGCTDTYAIGFGETHSSYPRIWDNDSAGYGSVIPRDVQHVHESTYPEPESLVQEKVSQIYNPCANLYHTQTEILSDLEINDDVDADGEPDAMCDSRLSSEPTQQMSIMSKRKKYSRDQRKHTKYQTSAVSKRPVLRKARHNSRSKSRHSSKGGTSSADRTYACSFRMYGCESTFSSKNEWKRHFSSQHLKLNYWRCDLKGCFAAPKGPNDFNRKDLFTQHLRRMHAPWTGKNNPSPEEKAKFDETLEEHHRRCLQTPRRPPENSYCHTCKRTFPNWQDRMEHMSKHYEDDPAFEESEDRVLVEWAVQEGILCHKDSSGGLILTDLVNKRNREKQDIF